MSNAAFENFQKLMFAKQLSEAAYIGLLNDSDSLENLLLTDILKARLLVV